MSRWISYPFHMTVFACKLVEIPKGAELRAVILNLSLIEQAACLCCAWWIKHTDRTVRTRKGIRNLFILITALCSITCSHAMPERLEGLLEARNYDFVRALRHDNVIVAQAALSRGASLDSNQYEKFLPPIPLVILLQKKSVLRLLIERVPDLESGLVMATVTADLAALDALLKAKPLTQEVARQLLQLFTYRQSRNDVVESRSIVEALIDGRPIQHQSISRGTMPRQAYAAKPDAPEFAVVERLLRVAALDKSLAQSLLEGAVDAGDVFYVRWLLNRGIGSMTTELWSMLVIEASRAGNVAGIATLAARGHSLNASDSSGTLPLHVAIDRGNTPMIQKILALGGSANVLLSDSNATLRLPLSRAVARESLEMVDALIKGGASVNQIDRGPRRDSWAMREAVRRGLYAIVARLLKAGASPELADADGNTVLHDMPDELSVDHLRIVDALQRAGMNLNARRNDGTSILASELRRGADSHAEFLKHLVVRGARPDESSYREVLSTPAAAKWLLSFGGGDATFRLDGESLTQHAVREGNFAVALEVISHGGPLPEDVTQTRILARELSKMGERAIGVLLRHQLQQVVLQDLLGTAVVSGNERIAEMVFDAGGDPNARVDGDQGTMLHHLLAALPAADMALSAAHQNVVALMLRRGLDVRAKDVNGMTLLELTEKRPELASSIGGVVGRTSTAEHYGLHDAARLNMAPRVRQLLQDGAAVDQKDNLGRSALSIALSQGSADAAKVLLRSGASIDLKHRGNQTPLDLDFASDSRYAVVFASRLLQTQLISVVQDPDAELKRLLPKPIVIPDLEWKWRCTGPCKGEGTVLGNYRDQAWGRYFATRREGGQKTIFEFEVRPAIEYSNRVYNSISSIPLKVGYRVAGKLRIPGCISTPTAADCVQRIIVSVPSWNGGEWSATQGNRPARSLTAGTRLLMDRIAGDIELTSNSLEGSSFAIAVEVEQLPSSIGVVELGSSTEERVKGYAMLTGWREERLELQRRLSNGQIDAEDITETLLRISELGSGERRLSAYMAKKNFRGIARVLLTQSAASLAAVDEQLARIRNLLQVQMANPSQDLQLLAAELNSAIAAAALPSKPILEQSLALIEKLQTTAKAREELLQLLLGSLYQDIDRNALEYQTWALELAQYCELKDIALCIPIPSTQRSRIRSRLSPGDVLVTEKTLEGRGTNIHLKLGLPTREAH